MLITAIIQARPIPNSLSQSLEKALSLIAGAAQKGAQLIAFGESWLSGYPAWVDHAPEIAQWGNPAMKAAYVELYKNAVLVGSETTRALADAAKQHQITLIMGINERVEKGPGNGTLYNGILTFGPDGTLLNHHRKLMPTFNEKLVHGLGDGQGLKVVETPHVRVGSLICWEHWMPLSRQALHMQGEQVHVALWPMVKELNVLASRHYAHEGRCFVLAVGQIMQVEDIPEALGRTSLKGRASGDLLLRGGSCIIKPNGELLLPPQMDAESIFIQELNLDEIIEEQMTMDVSGHYHRPDVFEFRVKQ